VVGTAVYLDHGEQCALLSLQPAKVHRFRIPLSNGSPFRDANALRGVRNIHGPAYTLIGRGIPSVPRVHPGPTTPASYPFLAGNVYPFTRWPSAIFAVGLQSRNVAH
jgi:hypothetical protein